MRNVPTSIHTWIHHDPKSNCSGFLYLSLSMFRRATKHFHRIPSWAVNFGDFSTNRDLQPKKGWFLRLSTRAPLKLTNTLLLMRYFRLNMQSKGMSSKRIHYHKCYRQKSSDSELIGVSRKSVIYLTTFDSGCRHGCRIVIFTVCDSSSVPLLEMAYIFRQWSLQLCNYHL